MSKGFISYKHTKPDEDIAKYLCSYLKGLGHRVFIDTQIFGGFKWAEEISRNLKDAEFFIVLISEASISSDSVKEEVIIINEKELVSEKAHLIIPIYVNYEGELPYEIGRFLRSRQRVYWTPERSFESVAIEISSAINRFFKLPREAENLKDEIDMVPLERSKIFGANHKTSMHPSTDFDTEVETGAMDPESKYYIDREADHTVSKQVFKRGTTVIIKGHRQAGKSSLLARIHRMANELNQRVFYFSFQPLSDSASRGIEAFLRFLAWEIHFELDTKLIPDNRNWIEFRESVRNLTYFIEKSVLSESDQTLTILLDEVDQQFSLSFRDVFFGMLSSWHELRARRPIWKKMNMIISHSTDPILWIKDLNQSPFNVGAQVRLDNFNLDQIAELNARYGCPLKRDSELNLLNNFLGGHPYLSRVAFHNLAIVGVSMSNMMKEATFERGPYGDHLRRTILHLQKNNELKSSLHQTLYEKKCDNEEHFQKLKAAGLIKGESRQSTEILCKLYEDYFLKHL